MLYSSWRVFAYHACRIVASFSEKTFRGQKVLVHGQDVEYIAQEREACPPVATWGWIPGSLDLDAFRRSGLSSLSSLPRGVGWILTFPGW